MSTRAVTIRGSFKHTKLIYSTLEKWEKDLRLKIPGLLDFKSTAHKKPQLEIGTKECRLESAFWFHTNFLPLKIDMLRNECMCAVKTK